MGDAKPKGRSGYAGAFVVGLLLIALAWSVWPRSVPVAPGPEQAPAPQVESEARLPIPTASGYVPQIGDVAILQRPDQPTEDVPYVSDLVVFNRIRDRLRTGGPSALTAEEREAVLWVPAGTPVRVLNKLDWASIDFQRENNLPDESGNKYPWVKVVRLYPDGSDMVSQDMLGFTEPGYVARPVTP